jgi:uncharacterized membrane protein
MSSALLALMIAAALGAGIAGGVFFGFSSFVMPAIDRLPRLRLPGVRALAQRALCDRTNSMNAPAAADWWRARRQIR